MRILGCFAIVLGVLGSSKAQNFEWTHHFPSMAFSTSLENVAASSLEYGVYESGLFYKQRFGLAIKRSHVHTQLSSALLTNWINSLDPDWQHYYVVNRGVYQYAKTTGFTFSYRVLNRSRWTIEPNIGLGFITYPQDNFTSATISERFRNGDENPAPVRFALRASRKFTRNVGLRLEYRLKELGVFLNTVLINRPETRVELSQAQGNNVIHYSSEELNAPFSLLFEFGLRVRVADPFQWINIK